MNKGFADLCLTTWLRRRLLKDKGERMKDKGKRLLYLYLIVLALYDLKKKG